MFIPPLSCPDGRQSGNTLFWKRVKLWLAWISTSLGKRPKCQSWNILIFLIKRSKDLFLFCVTTWLGKKAKMCLWYKVIKVVIVLGLLSDMPWNLSLLQHMNMNWKLDVSSWWILIDKFSSFFLIRLCLNCFMSSFSSILTEKPY